VRRRGWFTHRTVLFLAVVLAGWAGWSGYTSVTASRKVEPAVIAALGARRPVTIWIDLPFPPEEFHVRYLQDRGTVTGVQGRSVHLARVRPPVVWSIARLYWVRRIRGDGGG